MGTRPTGSKCDLDLCGVLFRVGIAANASVVNVVPESCWTPDITIVLLPKWRLTPDTGKPDPKVGRTPERLRLWSWKSSVLKIAGQTGNRDIVRCATY